ncbi:MAG TPA: hypothetical protein VHP36_03855 [Chitinispirillaceae bacterium]|nr:hypothetical protein [Chitinispirillaceae bacterium]
MKLFSFCVLLVFLVSVSAQKKTDDSSSIIDSTQADLLIEDDQDLLGAIKGDSSSEKAASVPKSQLQNDKKILESDEELILDDAEEYILAPLKVQKQKTIVSDSSDTTQSRFSAVDSSLKENKKDVADSSSENVKTVNVTIPKPQHIVVKPKAAKIENSKSINFARNVKQYRSPKLAMLFSFLLPGSGQLYAHNKLKATIFGATELAIIGTGVGLAVKGSKEMKKARKFADENYSASQFKNYYDSIFVPGISDTAVFNSFFGDITAQQFLKMAQNKDDQFYEDYIKGNDKPYVRGWKDVTPSFLPGFVIQGDGYKPKNADTTYLVYPTNEDSTKARFGFSKLQQEFESQFSKANNFYDISTKIFFLLLLDRIVSAVDAGITAKAYNDEMLGKQSFWQNINIEKKQVNSGSDTYTGYALVVRF